MVSSTRQTLLVPSTKRREVLGEWHEGRTASYQRALVRRFFSNMDDSFNELIYFSAWPLPCVCVGGGTRRTYYDLPGRSYRSVGRDIRRYHVHTANIEAITWNRVHLTDHTRSEHKQLANPGARMIV